MLQLSQSAIRAGFRYHYFNWLMTGMYLIITRISDIPAEIFDYQLCMICF